MKILIIFLVIGIPVVMYFVGYYLNNKDKGDEEAKIGELRHNKEFKRK